MNPPSTPPKNSVRPRPPSPEKNKIDNLLELMDSVKTLKCYEYYDGLQVTVEYPNYLDDFEKYKNDKFYFENMQWGNHFLIPDDGENLKSYQEDIFKKLPNTNIEIFQYTSRFQSEISYECFIGIPKTLKVLYLDHYDGINKVDCLCISEPDSE
jgi:hypothetical protein